MINCGIEIEFNSNNYNEIFQLLINKGFEIVSDSNYTSSTAFIVKPEPSIKGFEINIPPTASENDVQDICNIMNNRTYFVERGAMHIHIPFQDESKLIDINNYYIEHEQEIINDADDQGLYVDLNHSNADNPLLLNKNLNIFTSFTKHHTIEHRIYKATFNYNKIMWAVNQTKEIINEATK